MFIKITYNSVFIGLFSVIINAIARPIITLFFIFHKYNILNLKILITQNRTYKTIYFC